MKWTIGDFDGVSSHSDLPQRSFCRKPRPSLLLWPHPNTGSAQPPNCNINFWTLPRLWIKLYLLNFLWNWRRFLISHQIPCPALFYCQSLAWFTRWHLTMLDFSISACGGFSFLSYSIPHTSYQMWLKDGLTFSFFTSISNRDTWGCKNKRFKQSSVPSFEFCCHLFFGPLIWFFCFLIFGFAVVCCLFFYLQWQWEGWEFWVGRDSVPRFS